MPTKFSLYFEEELVSEWRAKYVSYGKLKKALRDLEAALLAPPRVPTPRVDLPAMGGGLVAVPEELPAPDRAEQEPPWAPLLALLDRQLEKVDDFYRLREREAVERWNALISQARLIEELEERLRTEKAGARFDTSARRRADEFPFGFAAFTLDWDTSKGGRLPTQPISVPASAVNRANKTSDLPKTPKVVSRSEWGRIFGGKGSGSKSPAVRPGSSNGFSGDGTAGTPLNGTVSATPSPAGITGTPNVVLSPSRTDTPPPGLPNTPLVLGPAASKPSLAGTSDLPAPNIPPDATPLFPMSPSNLLRHRPTAAASSPHGPHRPPTELGISTGRLPTAASLRSVAAASPAYSPASPAELLVAPLASVRSLADARHNLTKAVMEYYRFLSLVRNFQSLNRGALERAARRMDEVLRVAAGAEKERRKAEKGAAAGGGKAPSIKSLATDEGANGGTVEKGLGKKWFTERVLPASFVASTLVPKLVLATEDLYVHLCTAPPFPSPPSERVVPPSERRRLVHQLRLPHASLAAVPARRGDFGPTYRSGLLLGLVLPPAVATVYSCISIAVNEPVFPQDIRVMLQIYGGFFVPLLLLYLFGVNSLAYARVQINYPFIFEWNPRDYLTPYQLQELALWAIVLVGYALYLSVGFNFLPFIPRTLYPAILAGVLLLFALWPFDQLHRSARWWFIRTMARIVSFNALGTARVEFRDFFITDELNSVTYTFTSIQAFACAYISHWEDLGAACPMGATYFVALPTSFPALWRLGQCLLRWRETGNAWPHGANGCKYVLSLLVIWFSTWSKISGGDAARGLWIATAALSATYSYAWDVYYDWGLFRILEFRDKHFLLRKELRYAPIAVYYIAIVLNAALRVNWVLLISPSYWGILIDGRILALLFALLEVYRRFQWNFFRMENEHLNNCGLYRAVLDVPLPFQILQPPTEDKKAEREERKRARAEREKEKEREKEAGLRRDGTAASLRKDTTFSAAKKVTSTPEMEMAARAPAVARADTGLTMEYTPRLVPEGLGQLAEDEGLEMLDEDDMDEEDLGFVLGDEDEDSE